MPNDYFNPPNSIYPNGLKKDDEGYVTFYPLGTNKVDVPTRVSEWPKGDILVSPFVYQDDKLVGFIDTKSLTTDSQTTIYLPYKHIEANFSSIKKGDLSIHAPKATTKTAKWSDSGEEEISEASFKYKGCKTVDDIKVVDPDYIIFDFCDGAWCTPLWDLEVGGNGDYTGGMFNCCNSLKSFNLDLPSLTNGNYMFTYCTNLTSFNSDLSSLIDGEGMFIGCENLTTFTSDLSNLTDGSSMFEDCFGLTSFISDLSSLTNGYYMFSGCRLDTPSVQNIANTINDLRNVISDGSYGFGQIYISINNSSPNDQDKAAFNKISERGWTVYVNGSHYISTSAAIMTLDEHGNEIEMPIPFYAKPIPATEETAKYVDENGNFFNILGAQFIYGDDLSTYGMFTCEADAAANMRLTKIEKGDK